MRSSFKSSSNREMLKEFENYYASYYEHIAADSLTYSDDDSAGSFITREYYSINDIWEIENNQKKASFGSFVIDGILKKPKSQARSMPYGLTFPAHYKEKVEINVPETWEGEGSFKKINTASFFMTADFSYSNKKFTLYYDYESKKDEVSLPEIKEFLSAVNAKENEMGYALTSDLNNMPVSAKSMPSEDNSRFRNNVISVLLILAFLGFFIRRFRNR